MHAYMYNRPQLSLRHTNSCVKYQMHTQRMHNMHIWQQKNTYTSTWAPAFDMIFYKISSSHLTHEYLAGRNHTHTHRSTRIHKIPSSHSHMRTWQEEITYTLIRVPELTDETDPPEGMRLGKWTDSCLLVSFVFVCFAGNSVYAYVCMFVCMYLCMYVSGPMGIFCYLLFHWKH